MAEFPEEAWKPSITEGERDAIARAVWRARTAVGELNASRRSEDLERARKGVEFELERALHLLGIPWSGPQTPGPVAGPPAPEPELPFA